MIVFSTNNRSDVDFDLQGFIDVTYLSRSGRFRLSRGNKGTLFVLAKDVPATQQLKEAIALGNEAATQQLVELVIAEARGVSRPAESEVAEGRWRLIWTAQARGVAGWQGPTRLRFKMNCTWLRVQCLLRQWPLESIAKIYADANKGHLAACSLFCAWV